MNSEAIKPLAEKLLGEQVVPYGFEVISVREGLDQTLDEAIFVTVHLSPNSPPVPGSVSLDAIASLSRALLDAGDRRFPFVRSDHAGEEKSVDDFLSDDQIP